ncbi:putative ribonuclease f1 [Erysiphe necator]|uniref:Putative ribonuclease f1 n=1 Tax=Uncinula necator TaxID=52586 RepID=A0A0B1PFH4_UNCNE|nr:putative ribonuclease f1 [Erysiphe necator]
MQSLFLLLSCIIYLQLYFKPPNELQGLFVGATQNIAPAVQEEVKGYECGNTFFTDLEAKNVASWCIRNMKEKNLSPEEYLGPLYRGVGQRKYLLWPIRKQKKVESNKYFAGDFYVVFTNDREEVVDVIARIANNQHAICFRRDSSRMESPSISETANGYQCGHKFFNDALLQQSLGEARSKMGQNLKFLPLYFGHLFPVNSKHLILPIKQYNNQYKLKYVEIGTYNIIIDTHGTFKDAVVKGPFQNFLRCIRTKAPAPDPVNEVFVPSPRRGFLCRNVFLDENKLLHVAENPMSVFRNKRPQKYPEIYNRYPYFVPHFLWPVTDRVNPFDKEISEPYRVALTPSHEVIGAAMAIGNEVEPCERKIYKREGIHETWGYLCHDRTYSIEQLMISAEEACRKLGNNNRNTYPAAYRGPKFESEDPYFTYPVLENENFKSYAGPDRVVINYKCEVAGALTTILLDSGNKLVKCHRLGSDPPPKHMPIDLSEAINEHKVNYK